MIQYRIYEFRVIVIASESGAEWCLGAWRSLPAGRQAVTNKVFIILTGLSLD